MRFRKFFRAIDKCYYKTGQKNGYGVTNFGEGGNNAVHFIDILRWGMGVTFPSRVNSMGGRYVYQDDWQFPDTQVMNFEFGNDKMITWEGRSCNGRNIEDSSVGCAFYGEKGSLVIGGGNAYKIYDLKNQLVKDVTSEMSFRAGDTANPTQQLDSFHFSNFLDGIRKGSPLNADINVGCISTMMSHLGNISQRTNSTFETNPLNGRIQNNRAANKLWDRKYQKGWEMKL
ncbi:MAG: Gfo/Idh/MocA family oxidoreductase [Proteiniphilum sp.]